jgi:hypothetical protein
MMYRRRKGFALLLAAAAVAVLATATVSCSAQGNGWGSGLVHDGSRGDRFAQAPADHGTGDQIDEKQAHQMLAQFAKLREVDPCALLDRGIIKDVTHAATVEQPVPGKELSQCAVGTRVDEVETGWDFVSDVGTLYEPSRSTRRDTVDGHEFFVDSDGDTCYYTRIVAPRIGVTVKVFAPPLDKTGSDPCGMAASYVARAVTLLTTMGHRAQARTQPPLPLAAHDPCEAVPDIAHSLHTDAAGAPVHTYTCAVRSDPADVKSPLAKQDLTISYQFAIDPRNDIPDNPNTAGGAGLGATTAVTIAGHPGSQFKGNGAIGCDVNMVLNDKTVLTVDGLRYLQVVEVFAHDCAIATRAALPVLAKIGAV